MNKKQLYLIGEIVRMDLGNGTIQTAAKNSPKWEIWDNISFYDKLINGVIESRKKDQLDVICQEIDSYAQKNSNIPVILFAEKLTKKLKNGRRKLSA